MPSHYTHYRFGARGLPLLPEPVQKLVKRNRAMYDIGQHGPDLFFYYNPFLPTRVGKMGSQIHHVTGTDFFTPLLRRLRLQPNEMQEAYLYGVVGHFCLDSVVHPWVCRTCEEEDVGHAEMEVELDRFLLERDGKIPGYRQNTVGYLDVGQKECSVIADCYRPATPAQIGQCMVNMMTVARVCSMKDGCPRRALGKFLTVVGHGANEMLMHTAPNPRCEKTTPVLLELYDKAFAKFPAMVSSMYEYLRTGAPLSRDFAPIFG